MRFLCKDVPYISLCIYICRERKKCEVFLKKILCILLRVRRVRCFVKMLYIYIAGSAKKKCERCSVYITTNKECERCSVYIYYWERVKF